MGQGPCPMILAISNHTSLNLPSQGMHKDIQALLDKFDDVFQLSRGLPPTKVQDHKIPLHDESKVIRIRPCQYPTV